MVSDSDKRLVVRSWPGRGTCETVYQDNRGQTYREVSEAEASLIEQGTCGRVYRIYPNGSIR